MSEKLVLLVLLGIVVGMLHVIAFWRRKAGEAAYAAARSASGKTKEAAIAVWQ
jgi:F0F1-type ATP synthase assembly protein I